MKQSQDAKTPSIKVGLTLIGVVLVVVLVIFGSKIKFNTPPVKDLQNVELVIERKTGDNFKSGDQDEDGLPDWLEEFYKTDKNNSDTDGDGTKDGEEVALDRDPAVAGPNDPLITRRDLLNTESDLTNFVPGTLTDKASIELFTQYISLKKQGLLKPEDEAQMIEQISKEAVAQSSLKSQYSKQQLNIVPSTGQSISAYAERYAQIALASFNVMDTHKNIKQDTEYLSKIGQEYKVYAQNTATMSVPDVLADVHIVLVNYLYSTGVFFEALASAGADPLTSVIVTAQYQALGVSEAQLYTTLANYFKNNDIIFDTESTRVFWAKFEE